MPRPLKIRPALAAFLALAVIALAPAVLGAQTLQSVARRDGILVSTATDPFFLTQPDYVKTLTAQYDMVEAENQMKWAATEPKLNHFNFVPGDKIVAFAEAHHLLVRGHNLLWAKHNPAWLAKGHFTAAQIRNIIRTHIRTVMQHYAGRVFAWDTINEALDSRGKMGNSFWYNQPGFGDAGHPIEAVAQIFRWAHAADPHALLFYNDYNVAAINAKSNGMYRLVRELKKRGVPIDGVGFQLHLHNPTPAALSTFAANLERFARLGVQIHITELDVGMPLNKSRLLCNPSDLQRQAAIYGEVASICARQPACTAIQTWGFTDRYSWIPHFTHFKLGFALPFNRDYQPKPAFYAMVKALSAPHPEIVQERRRIEGTKEEAK